MNQHIINLTDANFEAEVIQQHGVVLVDFWAEWCGPCKALAPILDDLADEYAGEARIAKINADENPVSTERFSVRGLPSMLIFVDGVEKQRLLGTLSKTRLAAAVDLHLEA